MLYIYQPEHVSSRWLIKAANICTEKASVNSNTANLSTIDLPTILREVKPLKKLRLILLATLLINVLCTSCIPACAETADIPIPMNIDIVYDSTEITLGDTITASWTYTAALPIEFYTVTLYMYNADNTSEKILRTSDQSITSISYSPTQAGELSLSVSVTGADGRRISENVRWTISNSSVSMQLPGDATGDHVISIDDAIAILKYQTNGNTNINLLNADINNDGNVNIHDALLILQRVAGW